MNWRVLAVVGACAGGVVWALRRRTRQAADSGEWAAATDHVAPAAQRVSPAASASS